MQTITTSTKPKFANRLRLSIRPCAQVRRPSKRVMLLIAIMLAPALATSGLAQQSQTLPGLVITEPDTTKTKKRKARKPAKRSKWRTNTTTVNQNPRPKQRSKRATAVSSYQGRKPGKNVDRAVLLVNGLPITNLEIQMRANLLALNPKLNERVKKRFKQIATSKSAARRWAKIQQKIVSENQFLLSVPEIKAKLRRALRSYQKQISQRAFKSARSSYARTLHSKARQALIDEQIKLNSPKELRIRIDKNKIKATAEKVLESRAKRTKKTKKQYAAHLEKLGTSIDMMRQTLIAQFTWREVIRQKYQPFVRPNLKELDDVITSASSTNKDNKTGFHLHRLTLKLAPNSTKKQRIAAQLTGDRITRSLKGCQTTKKVAKKYKGVSFTNLGTKVLKEIPEPSRSFLRHAKTGDVLPPQPAYEGFHLYVLCARKKSTVASANDRKQARAKIMSERLARNARGLLLDLRRRARIEEL